MWEQWGKKKPPKIEALLKRMKQRFYGIAVWYISAWILLNV